MTFSELFQNFREHYPDLPSSQVYRCQNLFRVVDQYFGNAHIDVLTESHAQELVSALRRLRIFEISATNFSGEHLRFRNKSSAESISRTTWTHHLRALSVVLQHGYVRRCIGTTAVMKYVRDASLAADVS